MCGRYQLDYGMDQLMLMFDAENRYTEYSSKKEVFPTDSVAIVTRENKQNFIDAAKWGFENPYDKRPLINARGETIDEKRTFKNLFTGSRCIIPATAFFEWRKNPDGSKTKVRISIHGSEILDMAGLFKIGIDEKGKRVIRCTILTTSANKAMSAIHDRMPVILTSDAANIWLDNSMSNTPMLKELVKPYEGNMEFHYVV